MRRTLFPYAAVILAGTLAVGCTATRAVKNARASFENAKAAGAERTAPYEYYAAEAYLKLAEHEVDEGDWRQARVFAAESRKNSADAVEKAGGGAK